MSGGKGIHRFLTFSGLLCVLAACQTTTPPLSFKDEQARQAFLQDVLETSAVGETQRLETAGSAPYEVTVLKDGLSSDLPALDTKRDEPLPCRTVRTSTLADETYCRAPLGFWVLPGELFFLMAPATLTFGGEARSRLRSSQRDQAVPAPRVDLSTCNSIRLRANRIRSENTTRALRMDRAADRCFRARRSGKPFE